MKLAERAAMNFMDGARLGIDEPTVLTQVVSKILTDCDQDALVLKVHQHGPGCCHAGYRSCFYRNIHGPGQPVALDQEIADQSYDPDKVYG